MVNIGDVARAAGVSRSTASYALSGKRTTTPAVQARVAAAVRELGYTTNAGARALATSQTKVIGLLAQFYEDEFAPAMLQYILGVSNTARELGYDVLLVTEESGAHALRRSKLVLVELREQSDDLRLRRGQRPRPGIR